MQTDLAQFQTEVDRFAGAVAASGLSAAQRYALFADYDPYPSIPAALLGAGHLASYAIACGMIDPFELEELSKPATYLVKIEGECRYRDEEGKAVSFYLSKNPAAKQSHPDVRDRVRLAPNSVCFLTLAPEFRFPAYLGARFNLLIRDVYRGLLVGTGPLVDPGFTGRLSIPIHNFTNREYFFDADEGLVYFEFTKLSWSNPAPARPAPGWLPPPIDLQPPFPSSKAKRRTLDDYLNLATGGGPPASSIGETMHALQDQARKARRLLTIYTVGGVVAAAGLFIATAGLVFSGWSLYSGAQQFTASAQTELRQSRDRLSDQVQGLSKRLDAAEHALEHVTPTKPKHRRRRLLAHKK